ncbi:hypothetical protein ZIOFF_017750 [Zingiber officinale]|uniref:Vesicle-fusing ATPase n=1 Tax=Zingiber officinale TaxID=94328 RepID=A0A8J5HC45_ZINOF|nr:hypothetical protein ZIOFF_017750 [Zingiber officinale]
MNLRFFCCLLFFILEEDAKGLGCLRSQRRLLSLLCSVPLRQNLFPPRLSSSSSEGCRDRCVMTTGEAAASPKVGVAFSNRLRHVESMSLNPSGAGRISHLNVVILDESLESKENDLIFPSQEFSSQALVSPPKQVYKSIEDPAGSGRRSLPSSIGRRSGIRRSRRKTLLYSSLIFAARTKNYSGAELEGVVRSAISYALNRQISFDDLTKPLDEESIKVTMDDFLNALHEVGPAFGASMDDLERRRLNGIIDCGERHKCIQERALLLVEQIKDN